MEAVKNMNGTIWIFAALLVGMVVVQALPFLRLALRYNKEKNILTYEELKLATGTGLIATVGPAFSSLPIVLSLIVLVGSSTAFMRCGVIGAAHTTGVGVGSARFTESVFTLCHFGMAFSSVPYFLNTMLTPNPLDKAMARDSKSKNKRSYVAYMSNAAMMAILVNLLINQFTSVAGVAVGICGGISVPVVSEIIKKTGTANIFTSKTARRTRNRLVNKHGRKGENICNSLICTATL